MFSLDVIGQELGMFTTISGLELAFDAFEYQEGGNNGFVHRLPGAIRHPNIVLSRPLTSDKALFTWVAQTQQAAKTSDVSITMLDTSGAQILKWTFGDAFPLRWSGPSAEANGAYIAVETVEITHSGMKVE
jgi:phage tail-like protein